VEGLLRTIQRALVRVVVVTIRLLLGQIHPLQRGSVIFAGVLTISLRTVSWARDRIKNNGIRIPTGSPIGGGLILHVAGGGRRRTKMFGFVRQIEHLVVQTTGRRVSRSVL
jgi:hypothetical protein